MKFKENQIHTFYKSYMQLYLVPCENVHLHFPIYRYCHFCSPLLDTNSI